MKVVEKYRDLAYLRYRDDHKVDFSDFASAYRRRVANRVLVKPDWRCLDIACGYGNFLAFLRQQGVREFFGVDSSLSAVAVAQREFGGQRVICRDVLEHLDNTKESYDFISALDFIEHLHKRELYSLLSLVAKCQTVGGLLLIRTPNADGLFGMAARYNDITHETCFTPNSIADVLGGFGYIVKDIWEDGPTPGTVMQTVHWATWKCVRLIIRFIASAETGDWGSGVLTRNMWLLASKEREAV